VAWPKELPPELLAQILGGGQEKIDEAGAALCGGHTVTDTEIKYGLSVTGLVHPKRILRNDTARAGDLLILTKPLGMGSISTAIKQEKVSEEIAKAAQVQMATLNKGAMEAALAVGGVHASTDVTGFGLCGHARNIANASKVTLRFDHNKVPAFPGALDLIQKGVVSGGVARARKQMSDTFTIGPTVPAEMGDLCLDAETSGGLLLAVDPARADDLVAALQANKTPCAVVVGEVISRGAHAVEIL
jgi:selenide,water dikinase